MRKVLATDFGIWPTFKGLERVPDAMLALNKQWEQLANYILLYDQIIIPTGNLQVLPVLRLMLGEDIFDELIRRKRIVLIRYDEWFGYAGNGGGLINFTIHPDPKKVKNNLNLAHTYFTPIDEAIDVVLATTNPHSTANRRSELKNLLLDNVVLLPTKQIINKDLINESYEDILHSPYLMDFLSLRNAGRSISHLRGLGPNQITIYNPHAGPEYDGVPEIRSVLRVAFENLLLKIGGFAEVTEITGDDTTLNILRAKGQRLGFSPEGQNAFANILNVNGVPDIGVAFANKQLSPSQLLDLSDSKHSQSLRDWFADGSPADSSEDILRRYVESIGKTDWLERIPIKMLRFVALLGISAWEPMAGIAVSAIDNFLLKSWFQGRSIRLFLKQAKVVLANPNHIAKPIMRSRDRNSPCPCGSGKKFKKCHGR